MARLARVDCVPLREPPKPRRRRSSNRTLGTLEQLKPRMLTAAGALDTQFNGTGNASAFFDLGGSKNDSGRATAVDSNGRALVAGAAKRNSTGDFDFAVTRFCACGSLDTSRGSAARIVKYAGGTNDTFQRWPLMDRLPKKILERPLRSAW